MYFFVLFDYWDISVDFCVIREKLHDTCDSTRKVIDINQEKLRIVPRALPCGMRGFRSFRQGGGGVQVSLTKKTLRMFLSLFYRSQMVNFKETYHFSRGGSNFFSGRVGPIFFRGIKLLIPYRNPYNLWFSRGGGPCPLSPPLDPHLLGNSTCDIHWLRGNTIICSVCQRQRKQLVMVFYYKPVLVNLQVRASLKMLLHSLAQGPRDKWIVFEL